MRHIRFTVALIVATSVGSAGAATTYSVTALVDVNGGAFKATAINDAGVVAGELTIGRAAIWTPNGSGGGTMTRVPQAAGVPSSSFAGAINNSGQVAGGGWLGSPFIWNTGPNTITPIPDINAPNGSESSFAEGINARGAVVGYGYDFGGGGGYRSYLWQPSTPNGSTGTIITLGGGGGATAVASDINDQGFVAGERQDGAFVWKPLVPNGTSGTFHPIAPLPGYSFAGAREINNVGQVVSLNRRDASFAGHASLWTPDTPNGTTGTSIDMGALPTPDHSSSAYDLNSSGVAVGITGYMTPKGIYRPFVWSAAEGMFDLNTLLDASGAGWTLHTATGINDAGLIVGTGAFDPDGPGGTAPVFRSFLLTPVPEPAGAAMVVLASTAALARRRR